MDQDTHAWLTGALTLIVSLIVLLIARISGVGLLLTGAGAIVLIKLVFSRIGTVDGDPS
jgi:hypothetical protein